MFVYYIFIAVPFMEKDNLRAIITILDIKLPISKLLFPKMITVYLILN